LSNRHPWRTKVERWIGSTEAHCQAINYYVKCQSLVYREVGFIYCRSWVTFRFVTLLH